VPVRLYVAAISILAATLVVVLAETSDGGLLERPWLTVLFATVLALEHPFEIRLARRQHGESTSNEEAIFAAMVFLTSPLAVVLAIAAGFAAGNVLLRRTPLKGIFNVAAMVLAASAGLLVVEALGGAQNADLAAALAVVAGAAVYEAVNRVAVAGALAVAGAADLGTTLRDDLGGRTLIAVGNVSVGLLTGLAAAHDLWTLPIGLAAMVALQFALTGHMRARAERQKLADIVASSWDGIVTLDRHDRVTSWNPASEAVTGHAADRVVGLRFDEVFRLLRAESDPAAQSPLEQVSAFRIQAEDDSARWIAVSRAPLPEGGSVLVLHDQTAQREIDELRTEQEREQMRADFVASVSHELRTPLTSILGFADTLLAHGSTSGEQRRYVEIIRDEGERLRRLIDALLDLRRLGERAPSTTADPVDIAELLEEQVVRFAERTSGHELVLDLAGRPLVVLGERGRLEQVVVNLLSNAIKYSPAGGTVIVRGERDDGTVEVGVTDRGLGIPAAQQEQIFAKFFRVDAPDRTAIAGSGLGLALAREIVEAHGGAIGFESSEGRGSTFHFSLPAA
jgi:two-component system, OmpR family, phosphate regulon sensor histidine kinase PhoR